MLLQDLRFALRSLRRSPGFAATVVLLVAVGVGSVTAVFSVVDSVLLRALPYPESDRLVFFDNGDHSLPRFDDWQQRATSLQSLGGVWVESMALTGSGRPREIRTGQVTRELFATFGAWAFEGRLFDDDDFDERRPVAVLSHKLWQERWGGDSNVLGTAIDLGGATHTVLGVLSPSFLPPEALVGGGIDLWVPVDEGHRFAVMRNVHVLAVGGRLAPGVAIETAQAELDTIAAALAEEFPDFERNRDGSQRVIPLVPLHEATVGRIGSTLRLFLGAVSLLLLIAIGNVASLLLARGTARRREIALRSALGAARPRLLLQMLVESLLLALAGGALGAGLAQLGVLAFRRFDPGSIPRSGEVGVDTRVLIFAFLVSAATGVLFGMAPAVRAARSGVGGALRSAGESASPERRRLRSSLVVVEVALALILLVGAGLLFHSFLRLRSIDPGFEPERLVRMTLQLGEIAEEERSAERERFARNLLESVEAIPGVSRAAVGWTMPFDFYGGRRCCWSMEIRADGVEAGDGESTLFHPVSPGTFQVLGVDLLEGRDLEWRDSDAEPAAAILNRTLAERLFPAGPASGQLLHTGNRTWTVVGVVDDMRYWGLDARSDNGVYVSYAAFGGGLPLLSMAVRSALPAERLADQLREAVWSIDPHQPIQRVEPMTDRISSSIGSPRFYSLLLGGFALVALVLAAGGIYGSLLYSVGQRRREMGIRVACGARRHDLLRLVVGEGLLLSLLGVFLGLIGSLALSRLVESLVFGIAPTDPATVASAALLLTAIATLACYLPARRAATVDPMTSLRSD